MKIRDGFVSNSSSTSFTIYNCTNQAKTLVDFVKENPHLIEDFKQRYDWYADNPQYTQEALVKSAERKNIRFAPGEARECTFGDSDGSLIGQVFDYILRDGGGSASFEWRLKEHNR